MRRLVITLVAVLVVLAIGIALLQTGPRIPEGSVLTVELSGDLAEAPPVDTLARLTSRGPALPTLLLALEMASADERVSAVLLHIRPLRVGYARIQELRDAVSRVRAADKRVLAVLDMAVLNATRETYLASAADQVYVVPGFLGPLAGFAGQSFFLGSFFEKIGVEFEYVRIGDYKSAVETFTASEMSEPAREMTNDLFDGLFEQITSGIAEGRDLSRDTVASLIESAPATADEYLAAGLADGIADRDEVLESAGLEDAEEISTADYLRVDPTRLGLRDGPRIALIFGDGTLVQSRGTPLARTSAADEIERALETAADDERVRAIVLRVNSPGGSSLASDQLWLAIRRAREKKPVVVSLGETAASGGYYVASAADAILAEPATLTGSIGLFLLRPSFSGLYEKLGIGTEVVARGPYAGMAGSDQPLTADQLQHTREWIRSLYAGFLARVAEGRGVEPAEIDAVGQGRVWLGATALEHGLVDELGGLWAAVQRAKREANIADDVDPQRVLFPGPRSATEQMRQLFRGELAAWLRLQLFPVELPEVLTWDWLRLEGELLMLPPYWIEIR
ncbi:MAG: signal peptide peptidase SppA [Myxococcota bacterium]